MKKFSNSIINSSCDGCSPSFSEALLMDHLEEVEKEIEGNNCTVLDCKVTCTDVMGENLLESISEFHLEVNQLSNY
jgi:hypothetical protein